MLNDNQMELLNFLKRYPVADQHACLTVLDTEKSCDWNKLSYSLCPLVKHKYITRRTDGLYSLLAEGDNFIFGRFVDPVLECGGNADGRKRAASIANVAAVFWQNGIESYRIIVESKKRYFIPSPAWRKIREGLVSSTRFLGMLYFDGMRLAVYYVAAGQTHWQTYGERSLHFQTYGSCETRATGVLMICDDGCGVTVGQEIIKHTMLERKRLIKDVSEYSWENSKKRPVSKGPVRLHSDYQNVYLAERSEVMDILGAAAAKKKINEHFCNKLNLEKVGSLWGPYLENHPDRYYIILDNDILMLTTLFKKLKDFDHSEIRYHIVMREKYRELAKMYNFDLDIISMSEEDIRCLMN